MQVKPWFHLVVLSLLFSFSTLSWSQNWQDPNQIHRAASNWLNLELQKQSDNYSVKVSNLDPNLKLQACSSPLEVAIHGDKKLSGRLSLKVTCPNPEWFVYLSAEIALFIKVVVAKTDLPRRTQLSSSLLSLQEMDLNKVRGDYFTSLDEATGHLTKNRVRAGEILTSNNLVVSAAVNKGEQVAIIATNGKISVRMQGEALENGKIGEQIRVKNLQSGRTIRAVVVARGRVKVNY